MIILFLIIAAVIIVFVLTLLFAETKVIIEYEYKKLVLVFKNGFFKIKVSPDLNKSEKRKKGKENKEEKIEKEEKSEAEKKVDGIKKKYKEYKELINIVLNTMRYRMRIDKLSLSLTFGTGNAASTGILYGVIWGIVSGAYNTLSRFFKLEFPEASVVPDFQQSCFDLRISGILRVRLVHIINTLFKIYFRNKKFNKERGK